MKGGQGMLVIDVDGEEFFDEKNQEFKSAPGFSVSLEHSLVSLSKWEEIHEKPFLSNVERTDAEALSYIEAMLVTPPAFLPEDWVSRLEQEHLETIHNYIDAKRSATWFNETSDKSSKNSEVITSELIYFWMISYQIPMECQNWHLNRLFTLIKVFNAKNSKPKKMSQREIAARNRELNAKRKAQMGTKG
jgi:hypothetical protein